MKAMILLSCSMLVLTGCGRAELEKNAEQSTSKPSQDIQEKTSQVEHAMPALSEHPDKLLWGDTHLHTSNSADAFSFGARLTPADAYKFARGEEVVSTTGQKAKLSRPLDFLVVADHAEGLGISREIYNGNPVLMTDAKAKRWHDMLNEGGDQSLNVAKEMIQSISDKTLPKPMRNPLKMLPMLKSTWARNTEAAETFNEPGVFTALIGYEYTSMPGGNNLHRVVVFRDGKDKVDRVLPFSSLRSDNPEKLWGALARYERKTGGQVLAIPHNSNISNGRMFSQVDFDGKPMDAKYTRTRARWEPIAEITQIKGDSETHAFLSPNDEFAGFGDVGWDLGNLSLQELKTPDMLKGDYVREALKTGLALEKQTGTNPFKLGVIGSTDAHTGLTTADEANFFGKHTGNEPNAKRMASVALTQHETGAKRYGWQYLAGGYAGVWARQNTREEIWDAMKRKEVYGTTGPRMQVRFFGGADFVSSDAVRANYVEIGYAKGVPMGGDLQISAGESPRFLVAAMKDPDGANLDRVQIIKGWRAADGTTHEKVYDVSWANGKDGARTLGPDGKIPAIGSTVNVREASYLNSIGASELSAVWHDPDFDSAQGAFYYVRVLEIPTPRWTAYDAKRFGVDIPADSDKTQQERAYTSPIWYTPQ